MQLQHRSLADRAVWLRSVVRAEADRHQDSAVLETATYWMLAMTDLVTVDFVDENVGHATDNTWTFQDNSAPGKAQAATRLYVADRLMELWPELPASRLGKRYVRTDMDDGHFEKHDKPTLSALKRVIIETVVDYWKTSTVSDEEAERVFVWLIGVLKDIVFREERKMFLEIMKKATGECQKERLLRSYVILKDAKLPFSSNTLDEFERHLAVGWARRGGRNGDRDEVLRIGAKLIGASPAAYAFIVDSAEKIAELDAGAQKLVEFLRRDPRSSSRLDVQVKYASFGTVEVTCTETYPFGPGREYDKNRGHDRFAEVRERIKEWKREHSSIDYILFTYHVKPQYGGNLLFDRSQKL